jgi:DNA replication licensing factor MCM6
LDHMRNEGKNTLFVDFMHVYGFNDVLANCILQDYYRLEKSLRKAIQIFVKRHLPDYSFISNSAESREFYVAFYGLSVVCKLRELTTQKIGNLLTLNATVTRTSEVRPELTSASFLCLECNSIVRNVEQQFVFTEPTICANPLCQNRRKWRLIVEKSTFIDWQRIHVQENSNEIPAGSMPRK